MTDATITEGARRAALGLLILTLIVGGGNLYASWAEVQAFKAQQQRQGQIVEHKICTTLGSLASLKPPAGDPTANPSRAYLQHQHDRLAQLGTDLGCQQRRQ